MGLTPVNAEDFSASPILPGRNLFFLKLGRHGKFSDIKFVIAS